MSIAAVLACWPLAAMPEVKTAAADAFLIQQSYLIKAPAAKVWESLLHPDAGGPRTTPGPASARTSGSRPPSAAASANAGTATASSTGVSCS